MDLKVRIISFLWGFAEATFFFIVPDVWLSRIAIKEKKESFINALIATIGALTGGVLIYFLAFIYMYELSNIFDKIPAISSDMIDEAQLKIQEDGFGTALFIAMLQGIPYKIYAAWAGFLKINFIYFIIISSVIRAFRFMAIIILTVTVSSLLKKYISIRFVYGLYILCWVLFYVFYFSSKGI